MAKRRAYNYRGNYRFTPKRKVALKRAAMISARKRRNHRIKVAVGVVGALAGTAAVAYAGHRYGPAAVDGVRKFKPKMAAARNNLASRLAVAPITKEAVRHSSAVSVAHPSKTRVPKPVKTKITDADRAQAAATRNALELGMLPPHMGGPDKRIYNADDSVNTDAMVNKGVRQTTRAARKRKKGQRKTAVNSMKNVLNMSQAELNALATGKATRSMVNAPVLGSSRKVRRPGTTTVDRAFEQWIKDFEANNG